MSRALLDSDAGLMQFMVMADWASQLRPLTEEEDRMRQDVWNSVLGDVDERRGTHFADREITNSPVRGSDSLSDTSDDPALTGLPWDFFLRCQEDEEEGLEEDDNDNDDEDDESEDEEDDEDDEDYDDDDDDDDDDRPYYTGQSTDQCAIEQVWWGGNPPDIHHYEWPRDMVMDNTCLLVYRQNPTREDLKKRINFFSWNSDYGGGATWRAYGTRFRKPRSESEEPGVLVEYRTFTEWDGTKMRKKAYLLDEIFEESERGIDFDSVFTPEWEREDVEEAEQEDLEEEDPEAEEIEEEMQQDESKQEDVEENGFETEEDDMEVDEEKTSED